MKNLSKIIGALLLFIGLNTNAQNTAKPITVIIPFSAGSASDVITRILFEQVATNTSQRFIFDNKPATGGNLGTAAIARAEPDGFTIGTSASGPLVINKILYPDLNYDPEKDFQPIALIAILPNVVVVSSTLNINTLAELNDYLRKTPDVAYGSVGNGSSQHLAGAYYEQLIGVKMTHIPYRVTANLVTDLVAGRAPVSFQLLPNVIGQIKAGNVKPLAVASNKRLAAIPNVPTAAEAGIKGYETAAWFAILAPKGTPKAVVDRLNKDIVKASSDPNVRARFSDLGAEPQASSPEELQRYINSEIKKWTEIIKKGGITLEKS
ncbi:MAG: tripartite tricarboxylate transporter substrate binding protein [Burkholderiales bacterium]|nr:tripartite tricarboxylate transporter substrate binding protein [Burkholderiales bacterium]